jgi:hypothetical protein
MNVPSGANCRLTSPPLGTFITHPAYRGTERIEEDTMDGLIYLVGLIVIIMAILSLFGLR